MFITLLSQPKVVHPIIVSLVINDQKRSLGAYMKKEPAKRLSCKYYEFFVSWIFFFFLRKEAAQGKNR